LNKEFCCWNTKEEDCDWVSWKSYSYAFSFIFYLLSSTIFAASSTFLVTSYAPYAVGSGIPEIKTILSGFVIKGFLGSWTLITKCIGVVLSVGSGLSVGKEGPLVHIACCIANIVSRFVDKYNLNESNIR
jgi:chloride channel 3/4/5